MTYGLPDSVVIGTARRVKRIVTKGNKSELRQDINWLWGWAAVGALWLIGQVILAISKLF
jgi:hypothetical protein